VGSPPVTAVVLVGLPSLHALTPATCGLFSHSFLMGTTDKEPPGQLAQVEVRLEGRLALCLANSTAVPGS
jgi:hypothetical protein